MTNSRAGQHTLSQHEELGPLRQVGIVVDNRGKAAIECPGPTIPSSLWNMMKNRDVGLEDGGEGRQATHGRGGS